jgi:hypothetical protein
VDYFIEQIDGGDNTVTFLNGEPIEAFKRYQLQHGNIISIAGSHFFRFNNPTGRQGVCGVDKQQKVKDYQYAKEEIERCQAEKIEKVRKESEMKMRDEMQQLRLRHQADLEKMVR